VENKKNYTSEDLENLGFSASTLIDQSKQKKVLPFFTYSDELTIEENKPAQTVVDQFSSLFNEDTPLRTYSFIDNNTTTDNQYFTLSPSGTLKTLITFDYETNASSYSIRVQARDEYNNSVEGNFTILLQDVIEDLDQDGSDPTDANSVANSAPSDILPVHFTILENEQAGMLVDTLNGVDADTEDKLIYSLLFVELNGERDYYNQFFNLDPNGSLFAVQSFDHEYTPLFRLKLRVTDEHNASFERWRNLSIKDQNEPPADLNASAPLQFLEEQPAGTLVGNFSAHDADANTTLTYSMLDGNGSSGNQYFTLNPNGILVTAQVFDYENNESNYSIRVRVSDELNASREGTFVIQLINDQSDDFNPTDANYTSPSGDYQTPPGDYQSPDGNYSSPSSDYQTPGSDFLSPVDSYQPPSENNQSIADQNQSLGDPNRQIYVPIVETFPPDHDGNGTYHLGGRILTDGGSSPFEVGIVLSESIALSNPIRIGSLPDQNSSVFHVSYADLLPGKTYYLRAYAVNQAGENQGSLKKFKTTQKIDPDSWYSEAEALPGGWKMSDWLGAFRPTEHQWIYHAEMGWLYPSPMEDGSLWLWNQADGWRWSQSGVYPYLFRWKDSAWIYLQGRINGRILYYNYSTQSYE